MGRGLRGEKSREKRWKYETTACPNIHGLLINPPDHNFREGSHPQDEKRYTEVKTGKGGKGRVAE